MSNLEEKFNLFLREAEARSSLTTSTQNEYEDPVKNLLPKPETKADGKKTFWWLKGASKTEGLPPDTPSEDAHSKRGATPTQSSVSSSMAEFLRREGICTDANVNSKAVEENKDGTDKYPSVHAESSATKADYSDDFTDDDISSIMDQLSQLAGSGGDDSGRSVGEILKEAEEVVRISKKKQIGHKDSKQLTKLSPLLKPDSHLVINLTEKSDPEDSEDSEGVYVRRERIIPGSFSGTSNVQGSIKLPFKDNITNDADKIFKQIEIEVKNKIAASKVKQSSAQIVDPKCEKNESSTTMVSKNGKTNEDATKVVPEKLRSSFSPLKGEPLSIVIEESASDASSLEADPAVENSKLTQGPLSSKSSQEEKSKNITTQKLEDELVREKKAFEKLKGEMNTKVEELKQQIEMVKSKSQEKRFALEKDVSILKATLAGYEKKALPRPEVGGGDFKRTNSANSANTQRLKLLEDEMQKQEQLIVVYQNENVKLCQDLKLLKIEQITRLMKS